jgi:hypothetical protein
MSLLQMAITATLLMYGVAMILALARLFRVRARRTAWWRWTSSPWWRC